MMNNEIDAVAGARGPAVLPGKASRFVPGGKALIGGIVLVTAVGGGAVAYHYMTRAHATDTNKPHVQGNTLPPLDHHLPPPPAAVTKPVTAPRTAAHVPPAYNIGNVVKPHQTAAQKALEAELGGGAGGGASDSGTGSDTAGAAPAASGATQQGPLAKAMAVDNFPSVRATLMHDQPYTLMAGTQIPCVLLSRLNSTVPGFVTCRTTKDAWTFNNGMVAIPRGSFVNGQYEQGVMQGQQRIFVTWTRITTPQGVQVAINSPAAGALGGAGIPGKVDNHFWQRFSGALMLSLVQDVGQSVANLGSRNSGMTFNNTEQGAGNEASIALQNTINIQPTLYRNQGGKVTIYVARDVDFKGVYGLEMAR